jgi:spore maturation protein CgeB
MIRRLGLKVPIDLSRWIPPGIGKKIDLLLVVDPIRLPFNFKGFEGVKAYYAIDGNNPLTLDAHFKFAKVDKYDYVFVASKNDPKRYAERGCRNVYWLPLACDPDFHRRYVVPLKYDVCFVGEVEWKGKKIVKGIDYDARKNLIHLLQNSFNTHVGRHFLHDMALSYSQSKIVFNMVKLDGLNMRIFEALGCGRLLITNRVNNGVEDLFIDKKELVLYNDAEDLISLVRYYLENEDERETIAQRGQKKVYAKHTYYHRAKDLLEKTGFDL